jgi:hypothetical protein
MFRLEVEWEARDAERTVVGRVSNHDTRAELLMEVDRLLTPSGHSAKDMLKYIRIEEEDNVYGEEKT